MTRLACTCQSLDDVIDFRFLKKFCSISCAASETTHTRHLESMQKACSELDFCHIQSCGRLISGMATWCWWPRDHWPRVIAGLTQSYRWGLDDVWRTVHLLLRPVTKGQPLLDTLRVLLGLTQVLFDRTSKTRVSHQCQSYECQYKPALFSVKYFDACFHWWLKLAFHDGKMKNCTRNTWTKFCENMLKSLTKVSMVPWVVHR